VRLEMTYGYGSLDRFGLVGKPNSSSPACSFNSEEPSALQGRI
jgi:hypothetical protein